MFLAFEMMKTLMVLINAAEMASSGKSWLRIQLVVLELVLNVLQIEQSLVHATNVIDDDDDMKQVLFAFHERKNRILHKNFQSVL